MITSRRVFTLLVVFGGMFIVAHTINAVIAEALFMPTAPSVPRTPIGSSTEVDYAPSALAAQIRTSGLFPIPVDPAGFVEGVPNPVRPTLNVASKIKLIGVVVGSRRGMSAIIEELASN